MASKLFNRQDVGRRRDWRSQMFCSVNEYISGESCGGNCQLAPGSLLMQGGIKPVSAPFNIIPGTPTLTYSEALLWGAHGICSHLASPSMPETLFWQLFLPSTLPTCDRKGGIKNSVHNIYWSHSEVKSALALWSMHGAKRWMKPQEKQKKKKNPVVSTVAWFSII